MDKGEREICRISCQDSVDGHGVVDDERIDDHADDRFAYSRIKGVDGLDVSEDRSIGWSVYGQELVRRASDP